MVIGALRTSGTMASVGPRWYQTMRRHTTHHTPGHTTPHTTATRQSPLCAGSLSWHERGRGERDRGDQNLGDWGLACCVCSSCVFPPAWPREEKKRKTPSPHHLLRSGGEEEGAATSLRHHRHRRHRYRGCKSFVCVAEIGGEGGETRGSEGSVFACYISRYLVFF